MLQHKINSNIALMSPFPHTDFFFFNNAIYKNIKKFPTKQHIITKKSKNKSKNKSTKTKTKTTAIKKMKDLTFTLGG